MNIWLATCHLILYYYREDFCGAKEFIPCRELVDPETSIQSFATSLAPGSWSCRIRHLENLAFDLQNLAFDLLP